MIKVKKDLTGWVMAEHGVPDSRLTVLKQVEDYISPGGKHSAQWLCECNCPDHNKVVVVGGSLKNGNTLSCGCLRKETAAQTYIDLFHKTNEYDLSGEYGIGWTTNTNKEFYFDLEDYEKIKDYCWIEHILSNGFHKLEAFNPKTKKTISMHVLLGYKFYDHIDRNEFNNRSCNLRPATHQENSCNKSIQSNNTSGVSGVCFNSGHGKWIARIGVCGKRIYLGDFDNKKDAIRARLQAEIKYYGEFAPQKHLFDKYNIDTKRESDNI